MPGPPDPSLLDGDPRYAACFARRALRQGVTLAADWLGHFEELLRERRVDLDAVLEGLVEEVTRQLDADRGTLYLLDHARHELVSRVAQGDVSEIRLRMGEGVAGWVAEHDEVVRVLRGQPHPAFTVKVDRETGYATGSQLVAPLHDGSGRDPGDAGQVIGVLQVLNRRGGDFDEHDVLRMQVLAERVSVLLCASGLRPQLARRQRSSLSFRFNGIVGESAAMTQVYDRTARAARTDATVLVRGESGSGKELIARALHDNSERIGGPFVKVDCAALPGHLIENELFGHERGAFTGADRVSEGKVASAQGGTLFLDEVGELPLEVQGKLLRLLQDRTWYRVGGTTAHSADVRFVCATHKDLEAAVFDGAFRKDLYFRLRVVEIELPSLRERGHGDLDRLIDHGLFESCERHGRPDLRLDAGARAALHAHKWPGNVRELMHCIESAVVLAPGAVITADQLPLTRLGQEPAGPVAEASGRVFSSPTVSLVELEQRYVRHVLDGCDGNISEAARVLGISRNTLKRKLAGR